MNAAASPRSPLRLVLLGLLAILGVAGFSALGVWQIERREWKLALIERVEQRVHAAPVAAPGPEQWPTLTAANAEYLRVTLTGRFLPGHDTLVRAVTTLGGGFWVMTPFRTSQGFVVLVNRGFVPAEQRERASRTPDATADASVSVTGLLRMTEPKGAFLRTNDPRQDRWYSRDVAAISGARGLTGTAPYFVDAEADAGADSTRNAAAGAEVSATTDTSPRNVPVAGLTVITFRNTHLTYALTWFALALMVAALAVRIALHELRLR